MEGKPGGEGKDGNTATPLRGVMAPVRSAEVIVGTAAAELDVVVLVGGKPDVVALLVAATEKEGDVLHAAGGDGLPDGVDGLGGAGDGQELLLESRSLVLVPATHSVSRCLAR